MADITPSFHEALEKHNCHIKGGAPYGGQGDRDDFLKEAYRIFTHIVSLRRYLRSIRQPYLSASQPFKRRDASSAFAKPAHLADGGGGRQYLSDRQRDQIDAESKQLLRDVNTAIHNLSEAERLRQQAEAALMAKRNRSSAASAGLAALQLWASGHAGSGGNNKTPEEAAADARAHTLKAHHESVLWFLRRELEACSELQMSMMEARLVREMEKSKSQLYKSHGGPSMAVSASSAAFFSQVEQQHQQHQQHQPGAASGALAGTKVGDAAAAAALADSERQTEPRIQFTPEQLQMLAEENQGMLKHFQDTLDQVRTAERSLIEISELQTTLANNLAIQSAHIDQLVADSLYTTENVGSGNKQLRRAAERGSPAKYVFYGSCLFSLFLIAYDLLI